jgi:hypothetical protein
LPNWFLFCCRYVLTFLLLLLNAFGSHTLGKLLPLLLAGSHYLNGYYYYYFYLPHDIPFYKCDIFWRSSLRCDVRNMTETAEQYESEFLYWTNPHTYTCARAVFLFVHLI